MTIPWRERLDWTGQRSPSNQERMAAMQAEIKELRAALRSVDKMQARVAAKLESAKQRALHWRKVAHALQSDPKKEKRA